MKMPVDYQTTKTPKSYRCGTCGAYGCKLWREYQTFLEYQTLVCCDCAGKEQKKDVSKIDPNGLVPWSMGKYADGTEAVQWTDQIGWRIPAIPTEEGDTYWGYTSVPQAGVVWWRRLPTRPDQTDRDQKARGHAWVTQDRNRKP